MDNFTTQFKNILAKIASELKAKMTQAQVQAEIRATKLDYDPIEYFNTVYNG